MVDGQRASRTEGYEILMKTAIDHPLDWTTTLREALLIGYKIFKSWKTIAGGSSNVFKYDEWWTYSNFKHKNYAEMI